MQEIVETVSSLIEHPAAGGSAMPLDMRGSDFEREVWSALQEIPTGRTVSYVELACRLGGSHLAQKLGEACAANKIAVVIPCHRVLRRDGSISGYRRGSWRKRALLEREYRDNFTLTSPREHLSLRNKWQLIGPDGRPYASNVRGALGGHRGERIYGRLNCPAALRAIARGGYVAQRVFFLNEAHAQAAGYRPCGACMPDRYARWKRREA